MRKIGTLRPRVSETGIMKYTSLALILIIAFSVRMLPVRWGYYLSEFDPYYQYRQAKYIVENGLFGNNGWINWHDYLSWYPWGNVVRYHSYPGLPLTAALFYMVLNIFGVQLAQTQTLNPLQADPVYILCVIFPVIMGTLTCLVLYLLGKDFGGETVGLLSSLFLALDPAHIGRTSLGFFDDETVGIFSMLMFFLLFIRSIDNRKSVRTSMLYSVMAGLTLAYLSASWGAARYPIVIAALLTLTMIIIHRYSLRLLLSYATVFLITFSISLIVPYLGIKYLFLVEIMPVYGVFFLLLASEIFRRSKTTTGKLTYLSALFGLGFVLLFILWSQGYIKGLEVKFLSVLNPWTRFESPLIESVAEHRPSAWGTFYFNWGVALLFLPIGVFFAAMKITNSSLLVIIYGLTSIFFASSMIRLNIVMSPAVSLLWAFAIARLVRPFTDILREKTNAKRKTIVGRKVGKEAAAAIIMVIFLLINLTYVIGADFLVAPNSRIGARVYTQAYSSTTIAAAGMSVHPSDTVEDWLKTLAWIRNELPPSPQTPGGPGTVIASWWDYGYWISAIGNRSSLADNGTWNWTQIQQIGLMFMSNETEAIKILGKLGATHVIVFTTFNEEGSLALAGGDEGKWEWMAKIPGLNSDDFGNYTLGYDWIDTNGNGYADESDSFPNNNLGQSSTLYRLMTYGRETTIYGYSSIELEYFEKAYFSQEAGQPETAPGTEIVPLVCVYEIKYPD